MQISNSIMEYKGFLGSFNYSEDDDILFGKLEFINDLVTFEGGDVKSLRKAFKEMVDDYIQFCKRLGKEPEKPFKGSFNVRVNPNLHRNAVRIAKAEGISLNNLVTKALEQTVQNYNG